MSENSVKGYFISLTTIIALCMLAVSIVGGSFAYVLARERTISGQAENIKNVAESAKTLAEQLRDINKTGTQASQLSIKGVQDQQAAIEGRVTRVENVQSGYSNDQKRLEGKIDMLAALLENKKRGQ